MLIQKQFSIKWLSLALIMCLMFSVNSCSSSDSDDDEDNLPSYVGIWERVDDGEVQELVITASSLKMTISLFVEDIWIDLMVVEGTYSVSGNIFTLTITRIGMIVDEETLVMVYYTPDDPEWDLLLEGEFELDESFEVKFVVTGNQLTIIFDDNEDGFFDPIEESETYTKK